MIIKGELELKRGTVLQKSLSYFNKAVEMNEYDEVALVARSRFVNFYLKSICLTLPKVLSCVWAQL